MLINDKTSAQDLVKAWKNIAFGLDAIKNETFSRLEEKKYQNEEEREILQDLDDVLEDVIDWRMFGYWRWYSKLRGL